MDVKDARKVLRVLSAAYPSFPVGDDTVELYLAVLCGHVADGDVGLAAAERWVITGGHAPDGERDRFPTPNQLLEACQAEARRVAASKVDETKQIPENPGDRQLSKQENAERLRELRKGLGQIGRRAV